MQASSQRTSQVRLAFMVIVGVAAAAACVVTLMWWKAPAASGQEEPSPTGANFVVRCGFSKEAQVDPIVNPGEPGTPEAKAHHLHHFFGNTTIDSNSTLESLRAAASRRDHGTTCEPRPGLPPNATFGDTAAYWIPRVSWKDSRRTTALKASQTFFYYRAGLKAPADVKPFPAGLKIVTVQGQNVEWRCQNGSWSRTPPTRCENGRLVLRIFFPDCLQVDASGRPLTDTDPNDPNAIPHRSHMVAAGSAGCPPSHPYPVPRLQTNFQFPIPTTRGTPTLSSGAYSTMHADFFNAWQEGTLEDLVARCINAGPFTATKPKPKDCL
jgi:Domain of unknown function (DUF1996)